MSSEAISQSDIVKKNSVAIAEMQRKVTEARTM